MPEARHIGTPHRFKGQRIADMLGISRTELLARIKKAEAQIRK
jgi:hypothetical protein